MKTILLVDDEPGVLGCLGEILRRLGYDVRAEQDPGTALAEVRAGMKLDLVITDYRMPKMNGLEFLLLVKIMNPVVPTIILTGQGDVEAYCKSQNLGVIKFIAKPVKVREFGPLVKAVLEEAERREVKRGKSVSASASFADGDIPAC